jgi:hypothetical protein
MCEKSLILHRWCRIRPRSGRGGRRFKSCHSDQLSCRSDRLRGQLCGMKPFHRGGEGPRWRKIGPQLCSPAGSTHPHGDLGMPSAPLLENCHRAHARGCLQHRHDLALPYPRRAGRDADAHGASSSGTAAAVRLRFSLRRSKPIYSCRGITNPARIRCNSVVSWLSSAAERDLKTAPKRPRLVSNAFLIVVSPLAVSRAISLRRSSVSE